MVARNLPKVEARVRFPSPARRQSVVAEVEYLSQGLDCLIMRALRLVIATTLVSLVSISQANAHTELVSSNPASGQTITAGQVIELTFSEAPLLAGSSISVVDQEGNTLDTSLPTLDGNVLSVDWPQDAPAGQMTVNWRAVADDGHVVSDSFTFTYEPDQVDEVIVPETDVPTDEPADQPTELHARSATAVPRNKDSQIPAFSAVLLILLSAVLIPIIQRKK